MLTLIFRSVYTLVRYLLYCIVNDTYEPIGVQAATLSSSCVCVWRLVRGPVGFDRVLCRSLANVRAHFLTYVVLLLFLPSLGIVLLATDMHYRHGMMTLLDACRTRAVRIVTHLSHESFFF
jgi:hypothetical protein